VFDNATTHRKRADDALSARHISDGTHQSLYYESGPDAGLFKGMANILIERGFNANHIQKLKAQCGTSFNCAPGTVDCCCRRVLFNQPDFAGVKSLLETACSERGVEVWFLPKFDCELTPIEQCWGYAKQLYRLSAESSREDDLEKNTLAALEAIPIVSMRRYVL